MKHAVYSIASFILFVQMGCATAQQIHFKDHDETSVMPLHPLSATIDPGENSVSIEQIGDFLIMTGNSIPEHNVGPFPNEWNPNPITEQELSLRIPANPQQNPDKTPLEIGWNFGVSKGGIHFDPIAAEFWAGDSHSGWNYYPLGGAIELGIDENIAHVQPTGAYHYHGIPSGLMEMAGHNSNGHSPQIGYAADGFPIYSIHGSVDGMVTPMTSSFNLKSGSRPGGTEPDGSYDGTFHQDYEFIEGSGLLDECNGTMTVSAEYPEGTYAYFLTEEYPVVPMCWSGTPDDSFSNRPK